MKLLKEPFCEIKEGRKNVEMRLYDEKRQGIAVGDIVVFSCAEFGDEKITARVQGTYIYEDFLALAENYSPRALGFDGFSSEYIANYMRNIYVDAEVRKYGAFAILLAIEK